MPMLTTLRDPLAGVALSTRRRAPGRRRRPSGRAPRARRPPRPAPSTVERRVARQPQRGVQHRAVLGDVDVLAARTSRRSAPRSPDSSASCDQQLERLGPSPAAWSSRGRGRRLRGQPRRRGPGRRRTGRAGGRTRSRRGGPRARGRRRAVAAGSSSWSRCLPYPVAPGCSAGALACWPLVTRPRLEATCPSQKTGPPSTSSASTRSARCRWTRSRRRTPAIPGTPMALAPLAYVLYTRIMRHAPDDPEWPDRDRFVLSLRARLDAPVLDALPDRLRPRRSTTSRTSASSARPPPGTPSTATPPASRPPPARSARASPTPSAWRSPSACSPRASTARATRSSTTTRTSIASDGDLEEGVASEAVLAGRPPRPRPPDRLLRRQPHLDRGRHGARRSPRTSARASRPTAGTCSTSARTSGSTASRPALERRAGRERPPDADRRAHAHRARLAEQAGHARARTARRSARRRSGSPRRPTAGRARSRSSSPTRRSRTSASAIDRGRGAGRRVAASASTPTAAAHPDLAAEFERIIAGTLPDGWDADVPEQGARTTGMIATRKASQRGHPVGRRAGARARRRLGRPRALDADADRRRRRRRARRLRRAQPALRHPRARDGRDRQRPRASAASAPSARLPDLQRLHEGRRSGSPRSCGIPSIFVFTHDSIGLGEDGPTHQPIEQLAHAARDAEHQRRAPRRLQRDRAGLAASRSAPDRDADRARAVPPGPADLGPGRRARRRDRARRLRAQGLRAASPS